MLDGVMRSSEGDSISLRHQHLKACSLRKRGLPNVPEATATTELGVAEGVPKARVARNLGVACSELHDVLAGGRLCVIRSRWIFESSITSVCKR